MAGKQKTDTSQKETKLTVEESFRELEQIAEKLEAPDITLEDSMQLYRTGVGLLKQCKIRLDEIETEMITLTEEGEMPDEKYE